MLRVLIGRGFHTGYLGDAQKHWMGNKYMCALDLLSACAIRKPASTVQAIHSYPQLSTAIHSPACVYVN